MIRKIDRLLLRVPSLPGAVRYYCDVLGFKLIKQDARLASLKFADSDAELVLHTDADLPAEAVYYLVDDVRDLYRKRSELKLTFDNPPAPSGRGYRATVRDPFGNVLLILDRSTEAGSSAVIEDAKSASGSLFAGVEHRVAPRKEALVSVYEKIGRTADDLPYTPHFESLYLGYIAALREPKPTRAEVWRHLLNLRKKKGILPKFGEARSATPEVSPEAREALRTALGADIGKRDRLPYTPRFDKLVDDFNKTQQRPLSPHLVWRLVATLAK